MYWLCTGCALVSHWLLQRQPHTSHAIIAHVQANFYRAQAVSFRDGTLLFRYLISAIENGEEKQWLIVVRSIHISR